MISSWNLADDMMVTWHGKSETDWSYRISNDERMGEVLLPGISMSLSEQSS
jgi:hypothetical protein